MPRNGLLEHQANRVLRWKGTNPLSPVSMLSKPYKSIYTRTCAPAEISTSSTIPAEYIKDLILLCTENIWEKNFQTNWCCDTGKFFGSSLGWRGKMEQNVLDGILKFCLHRRYFDDIIISSADGTFWPFYQRSKNSIHSNLFWFSRRQKG